MRETTTRTSGTATGAIRGTAAIVTRAIGGRAACQGRG